MNLSPAARIRRGFARAGIVLGLISALLVGTLHFIGGYMQQQGDFLYVLAVSIAVAGASFALLFGISWALGWIVSGFARDE